MQHAYRRQVFGTGQLSARLPAKRQCGLHCDTAQQRHTSRQHSAERDNSNSVFPYSTSSAHGGPRQHSPSSRARLGSQENEMTVTPLRPPFSSTCCTVTLSDHTEPATNGRASHEPVPSQSTSESTIISVRKKKPPDDAGCARRAREGQTALAWGVGTLHCCASHLYVADISNRSACSSLSFRYVDATTASMATKSSSK